MRSTTRPWRWTVSTAIVLSVLLAAPAATASAGEHVQRSPQQMEKGLDNLLTQCAKHAGPEKCAIELRQFVKKFGTTPSDGTPLPDWGRICIRCDLVVDDGGGGGGVVSPPPPNAVYQECMRRGLGDQICSAVVTAGWAAISFIDTILPVVRFVNPSLALALEKFRDYLVTSGFPVR